MASKASNPKPVRCWAVYSGPIGFVRAYSLRKDADGGRLRGDRIVRGTFHPDPPRAKKKGGRKR